MKKLLSIFVLSIVLVSVLFAGGSQESASSSAKSAKVITVTYATGDTTTKEAVHSIIEKFNKSQSDYKIQENLSISTGAYLDSLKTLNASGQMPDFFECRDVPVFVRAGMLAPLPEDLLPLFSSTIKVYGTTYTAPFVAAYPHMILYNKTLFEKYGINENPKTYSEFLQICEDIKAKTGIAPMAAGVADIWHIGFLFNYYLANYATGNDPDFVAKLYTGEAKFNTPEMIDAMTRLQYLFQNDMEKGFMSTKESQLVSLLVGEKAAMVFTGSWTISSILEADPDFKIGFFPIPDDNGNVLLQGGAQAQGWALTAEAAKDPEKVEGFKAFIRFFMADENYREFLSVTNAFPTKDIEYSSTELMDAILEMNNKYDKLLIWNVGVGANELPPSYRNWTYKKVQEMLTGKLTPEQLVKDMDAEWAVATRDFNPSVLVEAAF